MRPGEIAEIKTDDDGRDMAGKTCTIVYVDPTRPDEDGYDGYGVLVKVDGWNRGHAGDGPPCGNRDCWWVRYQNLRPFVDYEQTNSAFDKLYEQEDELEWARDLVSGVENYWDVFRQRTPKNLDELKFKLIPKSSGSEYFKESLDSCSFNGNVEWWFKQIFRIGKIRRMVRSGSDCEAGLVFNMDIEEDVLSAQLVECLTDETDYDLPFWINEDMVDIIVVE